MRVVEQSAATVTGNTIKEPGTHGVSVGSGTSVTVEDNTVTSPVECGIRCDGGNVEVRRNTVAGGRMSVGLYGRAIGCVLENNTLTASKENSVYVTDASEISITSNKIDRAGTAAVRVVNQSVATVEDNTITLPGTHGVSVDTGAAATVTDNTITNAGKSGVVLASAKNNCSVISNHIEHSAATGIQISATGNAFVEDNEILESQSSGIYVWASEGSFASATVRDNRSVSSSAKDRDIRIGTYVTSTVVSGNIVGVRGWIVAAGSKATLEDNKYDLALGSVSRIADRAFTDVSLTPAPHVTFAGRVLTEGKDYAVSYEDNDGVGEAVAVITGAGAYVGELRTSFRIVKGIQHISFSANTIAKSYGDAVFSLGAMLEVGDGDLSYASSDKSIVTVSADGMVSIKGVGSATVTVNAGATDNFEAASASVKVSVAKASNGLVAKASKANVQTTYSPSAVAILACNAIASGAKGVTTYTNASSDVTAKRFTVNKTNGEVTVPKGTAVGVYTLMVKVTAAGDANYKAGSTTVSYNVVVNKAVNPVTAKAAKTSLSVTYRPSATYVTAKNVIVDKAQGTVTYANASTDSTAKKFSVNKTTGKVTIPKATKVGAHVVKVKVTASGNGNYKSGAKTVTYTILINKAANPMVVAATSKTASFATLKSKAVTVARPMSITKQQGTLSYAKVASGSSDALAVNKTTGKVTVKKGTKKGTYTIKIKVAAAGNANYKSATKTVTCKVIVK